MSKVNKVQCQNPKQPHYFDANRYTECPHCGYKKMEQYIFSEQTGSISSENVGSKKVTWFKKSQEKDSSSEHISGNENDSISVKPMGTSADILTTDKGMFQQDTEISTFPKTDVFINDSEGTVLPGKSNNVQVGSKETTQMGPDLKQTKITDLDNVKTVSVYADQEGDEPVTGWLVGINGPYKGKSFSLKTGKNYIGRDISSDILLKKDGHVSRRHVDVTYEPKKKEFFISEGEALTYLNDELLYGRQNLSPYDSIEIGEGTYLFVPFCGEHFSWDV